jgi:NADH:ubiquinone oxidoreductase subunit F (NADH-binding)
MTTVTEAMRAETTGHRLLAGWLAERQPATLAAHLARYGDLPPARRLIAAVGEAGLLGRGGAWFPTATKMSAVAGGRRKPVLVANGCEAEPASEKDHALLTVAPHLVVDGIVLAAHAIGTDEAMVCVHRGDPVAASIAAAIASRPGDPVAIRVIEVPRRFVASEESALVNFINTGIARPKAKPPRPFERGVGGRPTLVDNVETLAHIALIARYGPAWFRAAGTAAAPGTMLLTLGGAVAQPGVQEVAVGTTVSDAVRASGGRTEPVGAVLLGGFGGTWLSMPDADGLPLAPRPGVSLGVGVLTALPQTACGVVETARILGYLAGESANQCGPCMFGLPAVAGDFAALARGVGGVLDRLHRRMGVVSGRGACAHPDGAIRLAASALTVFAADVARHAAGRPCPAAASAPVVPIPLVARHGGVDDFR